MLLLDIQSSNNIKRQDKCCCAPSFRVHYKIVQSFVYIDRLVVAVVIFIDLMSLRVCSLFFCFLFYYLFLSPFISSVAFLMEPKYFCRFARIIHSLYRFTIFAFFLLSFVVFSFAAICRFDLIFIDNNFIGCCCSPIAADCRHRHRCYYWLVGFFLSFVVVFFCFVYPPCEQLFLGILSSQQIKIDGLFKLLQYM